MKKIVIYFLILSSFVVQAQKNDEYVSLCKTFGFLHGQKATIEFIKENYPELASKALEAETMFSENFGLAMEQVDEKLQRVLGDKFTYFKESFEQQTLESTTSSNKISQENAAAFLDHVLERAQGQIKSPMLENVLHYNYINTPNEEFVNNYVNYHQVSMLTNDSKVIYQLATPKSWKEMSTTFGQAKKFRSKMGYGDEFINVFVTDTPREHATVDAAFEELGGNLYTVSTTIETDTAIDSKFLRGSILYQALNHGIDIQVRCHIYGLNEQIIKEKIDKYKPLFNSIVASLRVEVYSNMNNVLTYKM